MNIDINKKYRAVNGNYPVRILCTDGPGDYPIIAIIFGDTVGTLVRFNSSCHTSDTRYIPFVEVPVWESWEIDDLIKVRNVIKAKWDYRYFAGTTESGTILAWDMGATSLTAKSFTGWEYGEEVLPEELENLKEQAKKIVL